MPKTEVVEKDPRISFKEYLEERGVKQKWLCGQTGLSDSHISNLFSLRAFLTDDCRNKINAALGTKF